MERFDTALFDYLASDPSGPLLTLEDLSDDATHPLTASLERALGAIAPEDAIIREQAPDFVFLYGDRPSDFQERQARIAILARHAGMEICTARLRALKEAASTDRPAPYDHPALLDLELPSDLLVPLHEFEVDGLALVRNGHAFSPVPPVESPNSAYWFMAAIARRKLEDLLVIRLDPLMHRPAPLFSRVGYRMWLYGRPLDLAALTTISDESHGRWLPGPLSTPSAYTDYVWSPRNRELHLTIEELPTRSAIDTRGSRYLHAIYDPETDRFTHADGAIRIFDEPQWVVRHAGHVRHSGKAGTRVKTFRLEAPVATDTLTSLCAPYFVWNYDVAKFCGMNVPERLVGCPA